MNLSSLGRGMFAVALCQVVATTCSPPPTHPIAPSVHADAASLGDASVPDSGPAVPGDAAADTAADPPSEPVVPVSLADSINAFGRDLHRELAAKEKANLFYSPLSISVALTMTYAGARGETAEQMAKVLHLGPDRAEAHAEYAKLIEKLSSEPTRGAPEVRMANRLWPQKGMELEPEFLSVTRERYRAPIEPLDFGSAPEPSRLAINAWVARQTKQRIEELLPKGSLEGAVLVLTNAIYFYAGWAVPFRKELTRDETFFVNGATERMVPTMHGLVAGRYAELGDAQVVELPYARGTGPELAIVIVLPKAKTGMAAVEKRFGHEGLGPYLMDLAPSQVNLSLPRFTATVEFKLKAALMKLGMPLAFAQTADFSGITGTPGLRIDEVFHKAFVETTEKGTEAAAATAVVMKIISDSPPPPEVRVDRPFLVFIRDRKSGAVLFAGRIVTPSG